LTKADLIDAIAMKTGVSKKQVDLTLRALSDLILEKASAGDDVNLPGIGVFTRALRQGRVGRNPATGETLEIPARHAPKFKAARRFIDAMPPAA